MPYQASAGASPAVGTALADRVGLPPGWVVLTHRALGGPGETPVTIDYVLLHPDMGIALLDLAPAPQTDAVPRLRRMLDTAQFRAIFGGYPPIIYCLVTRGELAGLRRMLEVAFRTEPPLSLPGGQSWMGSVLRLLSAAAAEAPPLPSRTAAARARGARARQGGEESGPGWGRPLLWGGALAVGLAGLLIGFYHSAPLMGDASPPPRPEAAMQVAALPEPVPRASPATEALSLARSGDATTPEIAPAESVATSPEIRPAESALVPPEPHPAPESPVAPGIRPAENHPVPAEPRPARQSPAAPETHRATLRLPVPSEEAPPAAESPAPDPLAALPARVEAPPVSPPEPAPPELALTVLPEPANVPAPAAARPGPTRQLSQAMLTSLLRRGEEMRELGDLSAARALLARAAEAGSTRAAVVLAATWDPARLRPDQAGFADPARALEWYRRAALDGDAEAAQAVARLEAEKRP